MITKVWPLLLGASLSWGICSNANAQGVTVAPVASINPCAGVWLTDGWMLAIDEPFYLGDGTEVEKGKRALKAIVMSKAADGSPEYEDWLFVEIIDPKTRDRAYYWPLKNNGFAAFKCENGTLHWADQKPDGSSHKYDFTKVPGTTYRDMQSSR